MKASPGASSLEERFEQFFQTAVALEAGRPLSPGAQIRLKVQEVGTQSLQGDFIFRRTPTGQEWVSVANLPVSEVKPHLTFTLSEGQAHSLLEESNADIGRYGILILQELFHSDPEARIRVALHAGFLTLFRFGYFGVIAAGGPSFASELASRGFSGMNAIKAALQKLRASS